MYRMYFFDESFSFDRFFQRDIMFCTLLKAKLHHLRVTQADKEYEGSLTIDEDLMEAVGILNYEKLLVANLDNGKRFETYALKGPRGSAVRSRARKHPPSDRARDQGADRRRL